MPFSTMSDISRGSSRLEIDCARARTMTIATDPRYGRRNRNSFNMVGAAMIILLLYSDHDVSPPGRRLHLLLHLRRGRPGRLRAGAIGRTGDVGGLRRRVWPLAADAGRPGSGGRHAAE